MKASDDAAAAVAEMTELDSHSADNPSSVIGPDDVSSVETSRQAPSEDSSVIMSLASVSDTVIECTTADPVDGNQLELTSGSPSKLVIDTSFDVSNQCVGDVRDDAVKAVDVDTIALCETIDETGSGIVVNELLPVGNDVPVTFPSPSTKLGATVTSGEDTSFESGLQAVADSGAVGNAAD